MSKKGLGVWIFSTLTAIAAVHLADAANTFLFNKTRNTSKPLPVDKVKLQAITPDILPPGLRRFHHSVLGYNVRHSLRKPY